ncbi:Uncharacterized protein TCM_006893 [Theobroma cacao]|uniref:Uncharacterized protein n=1 Tax=Theobroma cacao TaxID=3641 RepID=A0A061DZ22_THECC|nr:Uncharacterized protein TCM_006893 [Theobroma cacao]
MQPALVVFCERNASLVRSPVRPCAFHVKIKSCALFYSRGRELGNTTQSRPQIRSLPDSVSHEEDWECAILEVSFPVRKLFDRKGCGFVCFDVCLEIMLDTHA